MTEKDVADVQEGLAAANINDSEVHKLQEKQRAAVQRAVQRGRDKGPDAEDAAAPHFHPDLQDLSFGSLGADQRSAVICTLPPVPISADEHLLHQKPTTSYSTQRPFVGRR